MRYSRVLRPSSNSESPAAASGGSGGRLVVAARRLCAGAVPFPRSSRRMSGEIFSRARDTSRIKMGVYAGRGPKKRVLPGFMKNGMFQSRNARSGYRQGCSGVSPY